MEQYGSWKSKADATRQLREINEPGFQIKQKGDLWAVFRPATKMAEEFGAEDDYEKAQRIMKLLRVVMRKATGPNARYAKTYAINAENSYYDYGFRGLKAQVAYVLSNLGGWRGDEGKQVKAELRKLIK